MQIEQKKMIGYVALAGALCAALIYIQFSPSLDEGAATETGSTTSTDGTKPVTIEVASTTERVLPKPIPALDRTISFPSRIPEAQRAMVRARIEELALMLTNNPERFDLWMELGISRKSIDDFEGARQAWEYASLLLPTNTQSYLNLFDLYTYYLHDNTQALKNIERAIANNPKDGFGYAQLYTFYSEVTNEKQKAIETLRRAIAANVTDKEEFQQELDRITTAN